MVGNLRKLRPHLRHCDLNAKTAESLCQIGDVNLRMSMVGEIPPIRYREWTFEHAEKLGELPYIFPLNTEVQSSSISNPVLNQAGSIALF